MFATVDEVKKLLSDGKKLIVAADEKLLLSLPKGDWIGGTIPYFMAEGGGEVTKDKLFINEIPSFAGSCRIALYSDLDLPKISAESPENGFSIIILPAFTDVHHKYAQDASSYEGIFFKSIIGWVAGIHLSDLGSASPRVFAGATGECAGDKAVAMHIELPPQYRSNIEVVNIFEQGDGDEISFPADGFQVTDCFINGDRKNFYEYIVDKEIDTRLPITANFCGTMVNVSFQALDEKEKIVQFYAPVFEGVSYKVANPVQDYAAKFNEAIPNTSVKPVFACNCILNFLYGELEGKKTGSVTGPITFGEIAYQLLNQTMVYLEITDV